MKKREELLILKEKAEEADVREEEEKQVKKQGGLWEEFKKAKTERNTWDRLENKNDCSGGLKERTEGIEKVM